MTVNYRGKKFYNIGPWWLAHVTISKLFVLNKTFFLSFLFKGGGLCGLGWLGVG